MTETDLDISQKLAGDLAIAGATLSPARTCAEVFDWLYANPEIPAAAVVDENGYVVGLINRLIFLARYARQYSPELYGRKSILKLANPDPLIVDEHVLAEDLGAMLLMEDPDALIECFVVTSRGRYRGIVTGEGLLRAKVTLGRAREIELHHALAAARDSSVAKSNFLALMSHELRTPLNAIIGFSEIMGAQMFGALGHDRYREYSNDINGAGSHLLALINDILDLSKAEAGKFELNCQSVAPALLIGECLKLMRGRAMEGGLKMVQVCAPGLPDIHADRLRLKQVLLNLISNALKFTPPGGRVIVEASMGASGGVTISVCDTGIGMAKENIPLALEPFRQIASPFARNAEGTGLGLSLVKSLIELHDGTLEIESAPGQGTTARLVFPPGRVLHAQDARSA